MPFKSVEVFLKTAQLDDFTDFDSSKVQTGEPNISIISQNRTNKGAFDIVSEYVDHLVEDDQENLSASAPGCRMSLESIRVCSLRNPIKINENNTCDQRKSRSSRHINPYLTQKCYALSDLDNVTNLADRKLSLPVECSHKNTALDDGDRPISPDDPLRSASEPKTRRTLGLVNSSGPSAPNAHDPKSTALKSLGLPDVHDLVYSAAVAGQSLIDNKGRVLPSTVDSILSASRMQSPVATYRRKYNSVNPAYSRPPSAKRNMQRNQKSQSTLSSPYQSPQQKASPLAVQHSFVQFWEHDIHKELGGAWKSRRNTYLSFRLESYLNISCIQDPDRSETRPHKRSAKSAMHHTSLSTSATDLQQTDSTEIAVQESIMCSLQPCLLGHRWPEVGTICKSLTPHCESESLLLWK